MIKNFEREKLINAIIYFAENTSKCGKTKLFKLLYLMDVAHYQQTGRSMTGQDYYAWQLGPVPLTLDNELDNEELTENSIWDSIELSPEREINYLRLKVVPKKKFDSDHFTKREINILAELAGKYRDSTAKEMVEITHDKDGAWARVFNSGNGQYEKIPFELTLRDEKASQILDKAKEHTELVNFFQNIKRHCTDAAKSL